MCRTDYADFCKHLNKSLLLQSETPFKNIYLDKFVVIPLQLIHPVYTNCTSSNDGITAKI